MFWKSSKGINFFKVTVFPCVSLPIKTIFLLEKNTASLSVSSSSSRRQSSSTKMKPPPLCLAWGLWSTRRLPRPRPPAARIAPLWPGAATTAAAAPLRPPPQGRPSPRNRAGTRYDARWLTVCHSTLQVRQAYRKRKNATAFWGALVISNNWQILAGFLAVHALLHFTLLHIISELACFRFFLCMDYFCCYQHLVNILCQHHL